MKFRLKIAIIIFVVCLLLILISNLISVFFNKSSPFDLVEFVINLSLDLFLMAIPVTLTVLFIINQRYIKPITQISLVAKTISSGNLGQRVKLNTKDEVGELAININNMISNSARAFQSMANSLRDEMIREQELAINIDKLAKKESQDEALLANIGDAVVAIDTNNNIFLFNKAAADILWYRNDEVTGRPYYNFLRFFTEKDQLPIRDFINLSMSKKLQTEGVRVVVGRRDGQTIPVLHSTNPIYNSEKRLTGAIIVLRDITKERQIDRLKDEFVSIASHELRTPMTAIKGLISMIFDGDYGQLNDNLKEPLHDIAVSTERLINLVNDMLDVSRIEAGRTRYAVTNVALKDLIDEVVNLMKPLASQTGIELITRLTKLPIVQTDSDKFKQILNNLVGNSLKFTDKGSITVLTTVFPEIVSVSVVDTGVGISPEDQKKLFSKFQQISSTQEGRPVGTGLGLYISREYAKKLGGDLWIERSESGRGSTFTLSLPIADSKIARKVLEGLKQTT